MEVVRMTAYHDNRHLAQPGPQMILVLLLVAALLMVLALAMSALSRSAGEWPSQPLPRGVPAPNAAPLVVLPVDPAWAPRGSGTMIGEPG